MKRLLIVEDNPAEVRSLIRAFSKLRPDVTVHTSSTGVEAVRVMGEHAVDVVLTDLQMPEMDGFELLGWIVHQRPSVPVFTMSALGNDETTRRLEQYGPIACFTKPIDVKHVASRLSEALSQAIQGHVQNVSLAAFLQLMEMERKTCTLAVETDVRSGALFVRRGELIDAQSGELRGEPAAIAIVSGPNPDITISSHCAVVERTIEKPLGFILMEAMRIQDEAERHRAANVNGPSEWPVAARGSDAPPAGVSCFGTLANAVKLPTGALAVAVIDTATGVVLGAASHDDYPIPQAAELAALCLRLQLGTLAASGKSEGIEEVVLSTGSQCEIIRPLGPNSTAFVLLVFAPEETNLVMARLELARFIAAHT